MLEHLHGGGTVERLRLEHGSDEAAVVHVDLDLGDAAVAERERPDDLASPAGAE